jgi:hypothetical protein
MSEVIEITPTPDAAVPRGWVAQPGSIRPPAALAVAEAIDEPAILSLYSTQDTLEALANTLDLVAPEQEEELIAVISRTLAAYQDKRDRVARFVAHVENQVAFAEAEIKRLRTRKDHFEKILDKVTGWIERSLVMLGRDPKDKTRRRWLKLEGESSTLGLKNLPASVEIDDEGQIPTAYRRTTVTLPTALWERIVDALPVELGFEVADNFKRKDEAQKALIKEAFDAHTPVPGAHMAGDRVRLVRG